MAAWSAGRFFRLSTFTVAATGGALKISKGMSEKPKENTPNGNMELVLVQIAFRHGARTPIFRSPCQELDDVTWPAELHVGALPHTAVDYQMKHVSGGPAPISETNNRLLKLLLTGGTPVGHLTKVGQQQTYNLGKDCAKNYVEKLKFLQKTYSPQEIFVRTTNFQRTIDSARCMVAGMFGKENLKGLTIHTENEENEILYPNSDYCKNLKNWTKYSLSHDGLKKLDGFQNRQEEIYRTLAINYHEKPNVAVHLRDIVVTMRAHNMKVPKAINQVFNVIEEQALQLFLTMQCGTSHLSGKEVLSLAVGLFLEHIVENCEKKINNKNSYKLMLFSSHDTTLVLLLLALGIFNNRWPDFAADVAFELYRDKDDVYFVRVLHMGEEKIIPGCGSPFCPLDKFKALVSEYFVRDWDKSCNVELRS
ncbi:lysophosphatidic acid phosphatase type 6-like [Acropora millepora]|uniref:lysophosphatidic acid phosphatase type 6-like n=1 Tax=Acropora millepora TaxID=45264 RepID=UPI001CF2BA8B|nr:lysophosphatidic acid phosphatase type 6-like [Acropora millepora]